VSGLRECPVSLVGLCVLARFALALDIDSSRSLVEALSDLLRFSCRWGVGVDADDEVAASLRDASRFGASVGRSSLAFLRDKEGLVVDFRLAIIFNRKMTE
jgi:hypothetical protein